MASAIALGARAKRSAALTAKSAIYHPSFDDAYGARVAERIAKHQRQAREAETATKRQWHRSRARSLGLSVRRRVENCGGRLPIACGCASFAMVETGCGRRMACERCEARRAKRVAKRVQDAVEGHLAELRSGMVKFGRERPRVYLITLTLPHEQEEGAAERRLDAAWRRMRRHAPDGHWSRSSLAVLEWTPGRDGMGHPHMHIVVVSTWIDYASIHEEWRRVVRDVGGGVVGARGVDVVARSSSRASRDAGRYVASYVATKRGQRMMVGEWARLMAYHVGRRTVRATRGWWRDKPKGCACCGEAFRAVRREHVRRTWAEMVPGGESPPMPVVWERRDPLEDCRGLYVEPPPPLPSEREQREMLSRDREEWWPKEPDHGWAAEEKIKMKKSQAQKDEKLKK